MKKNATFFILGLAFIAGFQVSAQEQGEIRVGANLMLNTAGGADESGITSAMALNLVGDYFFTDAIAISPSYTLGFNKAPADGTFRVSLFNIDAKYFFGESGFYGLAGLGFASWEYGGGGVTFSASGTGLNLGAGYSYELSDLLLLDASLRYNTVSVGAVNVAGAETKSPLFIGAGISYRIGG